MLTGFQCFYLHLSFYEAALAELASYSVWKRIFRCCEAILSCSAEALPIRLLCTPTHRTGNLCCSPQMKVIYVSR